MISIATGIVLQSLGYVDLFPGGNVLFNQRSNPTNRSKPGLALHKPENHGLVAINPRRGTASNVVLLILLYAILAMSDNFKGIFIPLFKQDYNINNTQVGYVLTASMLAYAVFQYLGGILVEKYGHQRIIGGGILVAVLALLMIVSSRSFLVLVAGLFVLNAGMAMFNVTVNTLGPMLPVASTVVLMNIINFSYGVSNTMVQKITGTLLNLGIRWQTFYLTMLVCCSALFIYLLLIRIPSHHGQQHIQYQKKDLFRNKMLYLYIGAIGFYLAAEYGTGNWFVNYINDVFHLDANQRSIYIALFFGLETVGRLFGGFIVDRLGYYRSILIYGAVALTLTCTGILLGRPGLLIFALAGLAYSIIYPTIMITFVRVFKDAAAYATGLVLMSGTLIAMLVSLLIGIANDFVGSGPAFYTIAICLAAFVALMVAIWWTMDEKTWQPKVGGK
jgi:fucose permease